MATDQHGGVYTLGTFIGATLLPSSGAISLSALRGPAFNHNESVSLSQCIARLKGRVEANSSDPRYAGTSLPWRVYNYSGTNSAIDGNNHLIPYINDSNYTVGKISMPMSKLRGTRTWFASDTNNRYLWHAQRYTTTDSNKNQFYNWTVSVFWDQPTTSLTHQQTNINVGSSSGWLYSYKFAGTSYTYLSYNSDYGYNWQNIPGQARPIARQYTP